MPNLPATVQQAPRRPYSKLSEAEKWDWHAEVYAFRRVHLEVPDDVRTSPCDQDGVWFDEPRVEAATRRLRFERSHAREQRERVRSEALIREGRAICNKWARSMGYKDFAEAEQFGYTHASVIRSLPGLKTMPRERHTKAAELGVTATEYKPSPEESQRALDELIKRGDVPEAQAEEA